MFNLLQSSVATLLAGAVVVSAHSHEGPKSAEEKASLARLKEASYLCAPQIAAYNAQRELAWSQKVLGGASYAEKRKFIEGGWNDIADQMKSIDGAHETDPSDKRILACEAVAGSKIRNHTCVLAPESTEGPYFHDGEHPIRSNLAELKDGLPMNMQIGLIDVNTCEPIENVLLDIWHCDALGYYAGHPTPRPDLMNEEPAKTGHRKGLLSAYPRDHDGETWLRGAQISDENGVVEFQSIFPGYYQGRATHWHIRIHPDFEILPNNTYIGKTLAHTGQIFVQDDINKAVDMMHPYVNNHLRTMPGRGRTRNWQDSLNIFEDSQIGGYQSMWDMHFMGSVISQGLQGFITVVINSTADYSAVRWSVEQGSDKFASKVADVTDKIAEKVAEATAHIEL